MTDLLKIMQVLAKFINLKVLEIGNHITDLAADDIATVLSHNTQLQEFGVGKNNLRSAGAIKIAKALQNISTLTTLYINDNQITDEAALADDIATAVSCNKKLQELDISNN